MTPDEDELFLAALEVAPAERRAFVAARADAALAARVLHLLRAEEEAEAEGFMAAPPWSGVAETEVPRRLGPFEIREVLGRGGMGIVFRAIDAEGREVAVKALPPLQGLDPHARQRFAQEIDALRRLDDDRIVRFLGTHEERGTHLLVMEYVPGHDLAETVARQGPFPVAEACRIAAEAARGLHHAHGAGVVHRDVKPSNLILARDGRVKLLDLGLARVGDTLSRDRLTRTGDGLGTADWLAPEQIESSRRADRRADLYGLGCTLWFLVTGQPPFHRHATHAAKLAAHQAEQPPLGDVPAALRDLLGELLAKSPEDRPATALEVAERLEGKPASRRASTSRRWSVALSAFLLAGTLLLGFRLINLLGGRDMILDLDQTKLRLEVAVACCTLMGALYFTAGLFFRKRRMLRIVAAVLLGSLLLAAAFADWPRLLAWAKGEWPPGPKILSPGHVVEAVARHQAGLEGARCRDFAYPSLAHLHGREDVEPWRKSLAAWASKIAPGARLVPLDDERTVFALDLASVPGLRERWEKNAIPGYPYARSFARHRDAALAESWRAIAARAKREVLEVRGDWLAASARLQPAAARFAAPVDLAQAAAELGCDEAELKAFRPEEKMEAVRGLAAGGTVTREAWEEVAEGASLFQRVARAMRLGEPAAP